MLFWVNKLHCPSAGLWMSKGLCEQSELLRGGSLRQADPFAFIFQICCQLS